MSAFFLCRKEGGQSDDRYLWPEMLRVIDEVRPTWVIGENVAGITTMVESCEVTDMGGTATLFEEGDGVHRFRSEHTFTIERICRDLESKGYSVQPVLIPACAVGAPHRRDRVFIIAYSAGCRSESYSQNGGAEGNGGRKYAQQGEWSEQTEFNNRFPSLSRFAPNANCGDDVRIPGEHEGKSRAQRIQERDEIRKSGESSDVRSANEITIAYTDGGGRSEMDEHLQPKLTDGTESFGNGGKWDAADSKDLLINGGETRYGWDGVGQEIPQLGGRDSEDAPHTESQRGERCGADDGIGGEEQEQSGRVGGESIARMLPGERWKGFPTVSPVHRGNDGLPFDVDDLTIPFAKWRNESLKAYGNAIVPQVVYQIMKCIEEIEHGNQR